MKIPGLILVLIMISIFSTAQIERKPATYLKTDSAAVDKPVNAKDKMSRRDRLKELDLTREQKIKLKDIRQSGQAAKAAIENNMQLSDKEKKKQLHDLQKAQAEKVQAVLTDEQKAKFRAGMQNDE